MVFPLERLRDDTAGTTERAAMISSALRVFLEASLGCFLLRAVSRFVSRVKRSAESFSRITPLNFWLGDWSEGGGRVDAPRDDFVVEGCETFLDFCHIDVLAPCLLAFSGGLGVSLRCFGRLRRLALDQSHFERLFPWIDALIVDGDEQKRHMEMVGETATAILNFLVDSFRSNQR